MRVILIVAFDLNRGIGFEGRLPWDIPDELAWVARTTKFPGATGRRNAVLMGRVTYESIPLRRRPLVDRLNVVISRSHLIMNGAVTFGRFADALETLRRRDDVGDCFVFGGASIYEQALAANVVDEVLATEVQGSFTADTYFPQLPSHFVQISEEVHRYSVCAVKRRRYRQSDM